MPEEPLSVRVVIVKGETEGVSVAWHGNGYWTDAL